MKNAVYALAAGLLVLSLFSCARITYFPTGNQQNGLASWYGDDFHGKLTSCKETYDMHALTAAHQTLPFNSRVRVTNLLNGRSVVVRINDRGPFVEGRIIDMSYAAAKALDMVEAGVVPARISVLEHLSPKKSSQKYFVLAGSFVEKDNAKTLRRKLLKRFNRVEISAVMVRACLFYRVKIPAHGLEDAERIALKLSHSGMPSLVMEEYTDE